MFLNSYLNTNAENKELIDLIYQKIVKISRSKDFYKLHSVPDTLDGRFDLLVLFSIIVTFFLHNSGSKGKILSQILFDKIFLDLDLSLRELGAGDAGVHIKIKNMVELYMGRQKVYCNCLEKNDFKAFKIHIVKNIYRNVDDYSNSPDFLIDYCKKTCTRFHEKKGKSFLTNEFEFPII
jgi:cytochrome b pre-mRNA-processing protein 3